MYFVYQKQINMASEYNYDANSIAEWLEDYIDPGETITDYGKDVTAQDIVDDIFYNPDIWYDDFIQRFDLEDEVVENALREDIAEQIKEVCEDKLVDYYTEYLKENPYNE